MDDEDAERAWREALEAQQEELDLKDDEYYEELYRNTRINEGNKVSLEKEIQELNEQVRWIEQVYVCNVFTLYYVAMETTR